MTLLETRGPHSGETLGVSLSAPGSPVSLFDPGPFVSAVRTRAEDGAARDGRAGQDAPPVVLGPDAQGFTAEAWTGAFDALAQARATTLADARLHDAGLWFDARFAAVRAAADAVPPPTPSRDENVRLAVALTNALTHLAVAHAWSAAGLPASASLWGPPWDAPPPEPGARPGPGPAGADIQVPGGMSVDAQTIVERLVGACRYLIARYARRAAGEGRSSTPAPTAGAAPSGTAGDAPQPLAAHPATRRDGLGDSALPGGQSHPGAEDAPPGDGTLDRALERADRAFRLAQSYASNEELWQRCVWLGWYVEATGDADVIRPPEAGPGVPDERDLCVGRFRAATAAGAWSVDAAAVWVGQTAAERAAYLRRHPCVIGVERADRGDAGADAGDAPQPAFRVGVPPELLDDLDRLPPWYAQIVAAATPLSAAEVARPHAQLDGLSIRQLLNAWRVLASAAATLARQYPPAPVGAEGLSAAQVLTCAPQVRVDALAAAVGQAGGLAPAQAAAAVRRFVSARGSRADIWVEPLVPCGAGRVVLLTYALQAVDTSVLVAHWLRAAGVGLPERGHAAEQGMRDAVAAAGRAGSVARVRPTSWSLKVLDPAMGDVDLLVRVGRTLLVGEIKSSSVVPDKAHQVHNHLKTLYTEAAGQAVRNAAFVRDRLDALDEPLLRDPALPPIRDVYPVVVTTGALGVGLHIDGVPIIDHDILAKFLRALVIPLVVRRDAFGRGDVVQAVRVYADPEQAEARLLPYLRDPPQLALLREALAARRLPFNAPHDARYAAAVDVRRPPMPGGGGAAPWRPAYVLEWYVDLPLATFAVA